MDGDPGHLGDDAQVRHGHFAPPVVAVEQGQPVVRCPVDPAQATIDPGPGFVEVHGVGLTQQHSYVLGELGRPSRRLGDHRSDGTDGDLLAQQVAKQLGRAVEREVLMDVEIGGERPDPGPVDCGCGGGLGEVRLGLASTGAAPTLRHVLGDHEGDLGQIEDLAALGVDHRGIGEGGPARATGARHVGDNSIGGNDLRQMLALGAWLLARLALGCRTTLCP
jgi:hypothetical protein